MTIATLSAGRIGAILRKDVRLLWPLAALSALLECILGIIQHHSTPFGFGDERMALQALVSLVLVVSIVLVIVIVVQQDPVPGSTQDWVVRPIRRRDLLLAKLLTVALLIHGPIFVVQIVQGLSEGFAFGQILPAALLGNFEIALLFTLPVTAIAATTRTVGEALVGALAVLVGFILAFLLIAVVHDAVVHSWVLRGATAGTGVQWVWQSLSHLWLLAITVAVLLLQYLRRCTVRSRVLFASGLFLFALASFLPWHPAFAFQEWLGPHERGGGVTMAFETTSSNARVGPVPAATGVFLTSNPLAALLKGKVVSGKVVSGIAEGSVRIVLPITVSGLPSGAILHGDRVAVRLSDARGSIYRGTGQVFDLRAPANGSALLGQAIDLPRAIYARAAHQPVRLALDYSLTILRGHALAELPTPGDRRVPHAGRCADRIEVSGKSLDVACMTVGAEPPCLSMRLIAGGVRQGPEVYRCQLDYEPVALRFSANPLARMESRLALLPPGTTPGGAGLPPGARVQLIEYAPQAHFTRRVVIQGVRLADWRQVRAGSDVPNSATEGSPGHS
jgi:hypothetical protein